MQLTKDQIEDIARRKVQDYLQDVVIKKMLEDISADPLEVAKLMQEEAASNCNYDDKSIDKATYDKLQKAINKQLDQFFQTMIGKIGRKTENF